MATELCSSPAAATAVAAPTHRGDPAVRVLATALAHRARQWWADWRVRHEARCGIRELRAMDDYRLRDLGVDRGDIERVARHGRDPRRP